MVDDPEHVTGLVERHFGQRKRHLGDCCAENAIRAKCWGALPKQQRGSKFHHDIRHHQHQVGGHCMRQILFLLPCR